MKVAIIFIGTGKYLNFLPNYWSKIEENFLPETEKHFFVFTDGELDDVPENISVYKQEHLDWPFITLLRFEIINKAKTELEDFDYLVFMDADTLVVDKVSEEEFISSKSFFAAHHPCHYLEMPPHNKLPGSFETNRKSEAFLDVNKYQPEIYYQACVWGGKIPDVFELLNTLESRIQRDIENETIPVWHDESHLNKFLVENQERVHVLGPQFAYPEVFSQYCTFEPKIVHLAKDNSKYQV